jgi:predicted Zn-dependent peptidase
MAADLKVLKELLDSKTLTQEEFDKQKAVIMKKYE